MRRLAAVTAACVLAGGGNAAYAQQPQREPSAVEIVLDRKAAEVARFEVFREEALRAIRALQAENVDLKAKLTAAAKAAAPKGVEAPQP